jgi:PhnO protein
MTAQSTSETAIQIRGATLTDAPVVCDFLCVLEEMALDTTAFQAVYERNLANPFIYYLVAELPGEVIGFVSCHVQFLLHHCGKVGEIQELFVHPDYRQRGIGHDLVATVQFLASQENCINLEVTTNQKRQDTIRFYERESFRLSHYKLVKPISS